MSDALYRRATEADLEPMVDVFLVAVADVIARNNLPPLIPPRPVIENVFRHVVRTGAFHVAELDGKVAGISGAIVRDRIWFLTSFWARPDLQRRGIGGPLLRAARDFGVAAGAETFCTWSSVDPTAIASYLKMGMLPGYPIFTFDGTPRVEAARGRLEARPLDPAVAVALDREVRGTGREVDHAYFAGTGGLRGLQVMDGERVVGYVYLGKGSVGPAAWADPADADELLGIAIAEALASGPSVRIALPGINHAGLAFALRSGLRLVSFAHFLTTSPFGRLERYVPSGPSLF